MAAVVAAFAAVAVLPAVNSLDSMLIGIDANFIGVLSSLSICVNDMPEEDDDVEVPVAVSVRLLRACGDDRLCSACGVLEMSCGPADMSVSTSVPLEVPAAWATDAAWPAGPLGLVVCGGGVNGVT